MTGSKQGAKHQGADPYSKLSQAQTRRRNTGPLIIGATVLVVAVIALVVFLATRGSDDSKAAGGTGAAAAKSATQETASVTVQGEDLPAYPQGVTAPFTTAQDDPAVGKVAPTLVGESFDGSRITIDPADGTPKVILFVAHWCPHCQREVPLIKQWIADGNLPKGVQVYTVATATSDQRPNYPPSQWLSSVGWQPKVLLDDTSSTAAQAYGLPGFPYFVMTNGTGQVVTRGSGEIPIDTFGAQVDALAKDAGTSGTTTTAATG